MDSECDRAADHLYRDSSGSVFARRESALAVLMEELDEAPDKQALPDIVLIAAEAALTVASKGIASTLAAAVTRALARRRVAGMAAKAAVAYIEQFTEDGLTAAVKSAGIKSARASRSDFLHAQLTALANTSSKAVEALHARADQMRLQPDGVEQMAALADAYGESGQAAEEMQYLASVSEWARIVEASSVGRDQTPQSTDVRAPGVLGIELNCVSPHDDKLVVTAMHLKGLGEHVTRHLAKIRSGTLAILMGGGSGLGGMTVRVVLRTATQDGIPIAIPLLSRPGVRNQVVPVVTGHEGRWILERGRSRYGMQIAPDDFGMVPIAAQAMWMAEVMSLPMAQLPEIQP